LKKAAALLDLARKADAPTRNFGPGIEQRQALVKAMLLAADGDLSAAMALPAHPITDANLRVDSGPFSGQAKLSWDVPAPFVGLAVDAGYGHAAAQSIAAQPGDKPRAAWLVELAKRQLSAGDRAGALKTLHIAAGLNPPPAGTLDGWLAAVSLADMLSDFGDPTAGAKLLAGYPRYTETGQMRFSPQWMTVRAAQGDVDGALKMLRANLAGYDVSAPDANFVQAAVEIARHGRAKEVIDAVSALKHPFPVKLNVLLAIANMQRTSGAAEYAATFDLAQQVAKGDAGSALVVARASLAAGDRPTAARARAEPQKLLQVSWSDELINDDLDAGEIDDAHAAAIAANPGGDQWKLGVMFKIAEAYLAAGKKEKAIATFREIEANNVAADYRTQLDNARNLYHVAAGLKAAGDSAGADTTLQKAVTAAAALPKNLSPALLPEQLKAGDKSGAAASVDQLHAQIAKDAASPNRFARDMQAPNLRISEAEAHLAAGDLDGAIAIVLSFSDASDRAKGYHRLADRLLDRASPGIVGRIDGRR
jgi:hypothetical protein